MFYIARPLANKASRTIAQMTLLTNRTYMLRRLRSLYLIWLLIPLLLTSGLTVQLLQTVAQRNFCSSVVIDWHHLLLG